MVDTSRTETVDVQIRAKTLDLFRRLLVLADSEFAEPERGLAGVENMSLLQWRDWVKIEERRRLQAEEEDITGASGGARKRSRGPTADEVDVDDDEDSSSEHRTRPKKGAQKGGGASSRLIQSTRLWPTWPADRKLELKRRPIR
jgi:hypothetical protein